MRPCRAFTVAACALPLGLALLTSSAALAQWPAPSQQQAPAAGAWPAPAQQGEQPQQPAGAWPAPADAQPQQQQAPGAWPAPQASAPSQAPQGAAPQQPGFMPSPGFGGGMGMQQQQQEPPCFKEFVALRNEADKKGRAIQETAKKKQMTPQIACRLFGEYSTAEQKMIKFVSSNAEKCQMPSELLANLKQSSAKTAEYRTQACQAAAAGPPRPAGPSLSDVLSAPVPSSSNTRTGRGTFDTLSGSALTR